VNKSQTINLLKLITTSYPNMTVTADTVDQYSELLEDMPYSLAAENVKKHIKDNRFAPTIAEIRGGYTDAHERQKRETQAFIREQEQRKPIPAPAEVKARMDKLFGRGEANA
jgi:hypothetical protein